MKNVILLILSIFLFVSCTSKQEVIIRSDHKDIIPKNEKVYTSKHEEIVVDKEIKVTEEKAILPDNDDVYNIAVIYPSKLIGKYAKTSLDTIIAYFLYRDIKVNIKTFDSVTQDEENIKRSFDEISKNNFNSIIALYPHSSLEKIYNLDNHDDLNVYFPLISTDETFLRKENYIYGAISYKNQIIDLQKFSNNKNYSFYEKSFIGNKLNNLFKFNVSNIRKTKSINRKATSFKYLVDDKRLNNSTLLLNTPIIKSSIILSQLMVYDITPAVILSTQLNYNPLIISLTQYHDRINLITANSIEKVNSKLEETMNLLNIDINYNWVNYSILVGVNYLYDQNKENIIINEIIDNQVVYNTKFYKSTRNGFKEIK
ncbi:MAG: hypothetical protein MJK08_08860 [Campylobacterales bacterium]|nr:hypothetical protein [Campylobacterales bacterium]